MIRTLNTGPWYDMQLTCNNILPRVFIYRLIFLNRCSPAWGVNEPELYSIWYQDQKIEARLSEKTAGNDQRKILCNCQTRLHREARLANQEENTLAIDYWCRGRGSWTLDYPIQSHLIFFWISYSYFYYSCGYFFSTGISFFLPMIILVSYPFMTLSPAFPIPPPYPQLLYIHSTGDASL